MGQASARHISKAAEGRGSAKLFEPPAEALYAYRIGSSNSGLEKLFLVETLSTESALFSSEVASQLSIDEGRQSAIDAARG